MGLRPIQADEKCWTLQPCSSAVRSEPRPSGSGNAKHWVIESGTLIGLPALLASVGFSTEW